MPCSVCGDSRNVSPPFHQRRGFSLQASRNIATSHDRPLHHSQHTAEIRKRIYKQSQDSSRQRPGRLAAASTQQKQLFKSCSSHPSKLVSLKPKVRDACRQLPLKRVTCDPIVAVCITLASITGEVIPLHNNIFSCSAWQKTQCAEQYMLCAW